MFAASSPPTILRPFGAELPPDGTHPRDQAHDLGYSLWARAAALGAAAELARGSANGANGASGADWREASVGEEGGGGDSDSGPVNGLEGSGSAASWRVGSILPKPPPTSPVRRNGDGNGNRYDTTPADTADGKVANASAWW